MYRLIVLYIMTEVLTKWDFEKELKTTAESCVGVKEATARRKASALFKKYEELISYSKRDAEYYKTQYYRERNIANALRTGRVEYRQGKVQGVLSIRDIEQIEIKVGDVLLITKTGREITLGEDFEFLRDIF